VGDPRPPARAVAVVVLVAAGVLLFGSLWPALPTRSDVVLWADEGAPLAVPSLHPDCPPDCTVVIVETGLATGTEWNATLSDGSVTEHSTNNTINFYNITNGTYPFSIGAVPGYTAHPSSGNVTVNGTNAYVAISFTPNSSMYFGLTSGELEALVGGLVIGLIVGGLVTWAVAARRPPAPTATP
jgi:hypothetical protein